MESCVDGTYTEWTCWETGEIVDDWDSYTACSPNARVTALREDGVDYVGVDYLRFDWHNGYESWSRMEEFYPAAVTRMGVY